MAVLILVHEFGHFIVAKKSGIRVDEFGLGFPPKIFAKKWGDTLYTLNAIPFGGFVKIFGEDTHAEDIKDSDKDSSFYYKPKYIQAAVLVAGVTMNILFAWFLISLGFLIGMPTPADHSGFGKVEKLQLVVTEVVPNSPAQKAGLIVGDTIVFVSSGQVALQGNRLTPENVQHTIAESGVKNIEILYKRGDSSPKTLFIEPSEDVVKGKRAIGIATEGLGILRLPVHLAILEGGKTTLLLTKSITIGLGDFLFDAIRLKSDFSQVAGPIGIAGVVGEAKTLGFVYLLSIVALISINLAIINLIPFPALDGGRLLFVLIEAITRRQIPVKFFKLANTVGFVFLIILMLVVTGHDIVKIF